MVPSVDKLGNVFVRNIVSYQCFAMVPNVDKLGNIFVRNIVSYQCFLMVPSVDKLGNIFVRNIVSYQCFLMVPSGKRTRKHFCENHCFLNVLSRVDNATNLTLNNFQEKIRRSTTTQKFSDSNLSI